MEYTACFYIVGSVISGVSKLLKEEYMKKNTNLSNSFTEYVKGLKQPEKQEEWGEIGICKNCFGNNIGRKYHDADYKKGVKAIGIKVCLDCGCEDICNLGDLSQLLSERTFTKEELEWLDDAMGTQADEGYDKLNPELHSRVENKLSKLLKEEE